MPLWTIVRILRNQRKPPHPTIDRVSDLVWTKISKQILQIHNTQWSYLIVRMGIGTTRLRWRTRGLAARVLRGRTRSSPATQLRRWARRCAHIQMRRRARRCAHIQMRRRARRSAPARTARNFLHFQPVLLWFEDGKIYKDSLYKKKKKEQLQQAKTYHHIESLTRFFFLKWCKWWNRQPIMRCSNIEIWLFRRLDLRRNVK